MTDFLASVGTGAEARIKRDLRKLASDRHKIRDISKPLGQGLFELTTTHDGMEYRCLYVFHNDDIVILVCFIKKRRKAPKGKLDLARKRYSELVKQEINLGTVTIH